MGTKNADFYADFKFVDAGFQKCCWLSKMLLKKFKAKQHGNF